MQNLLFSSLDFLIKLFDSLPSPLFIVDSDVRIHHINPAATSTFGPELSKVYLQRGGDALHCLHSTETNEGCGHSTSCNSCIIRNSVNSAIRQKTVYRERTRFEVLDGVGRKEMDILVTTSPLPYNNESYAILIMEDITELHQLRYLLPMCSNCKSIRNDDQYWESVEKYFSTHHDITFSHGICPKCAQAQYWTYKKK
ncbi:MAG: PAS domain-containing protein [Bacteroidota bacterium]